MFQIKGILVEYNQLILVINALSIGFKKVKIHDPVVQKMDTDIRQIYHIIVYPLHGSDTAIQPLNNQAIFQQCSRLKCSPLPCPKPSTISLLQPGNEL